MHIRCVLLGRDRSPSEQSGQAVVPVSVRIDPSESRRSHDSSDGIDPIRKRGAHHRDLPALHVPPGGQPRLPRGQLRDAA